MSLSDLISAERRKVGTLFSKPPPERAGDLDAVKNARVAVDAGLAATLPFANETADALIASNRRLHQFYDLALLSAKADSALAAVDADRAFVLAAADTQKVITRIIDEQETIVSRLSPEYGQLVALARLSQLLRETAGLRSALLSTALASQKLTQAELHRMDELNGQISANWERIQLTVAQVGTASPELRDACQLIADTIMGEGDRRYRSLITTLGQGDPPEMSVSDYRKWTSPMLTHALALRNAVFTDLDSKLAANMRQKTALMLLGALSALVSLAATCGAVWEVMRRVAIPLSHLTAVVTRMAEGGGRT